MTAAAAAHVRIGIIWGGSTNWPDSVLNGWTDKQPSAYKCTDMARIEVVDKLDRRAAKRLCFDFIDLAIKLW